MGQVEKTVFISYRRKDISWALLVYKYLSENGFDVFFDFNSISSGDFEKIIISNIKARAHFLVILTPSALDRCNEVGDWLRREIEVAISEKRNIIPLFFDGFNFGTPSTSKNLTGKLATLKKYNGLDVPSNYFDEAMERLQRFLNIALDAVLHPVPDEVRAVIKEQKHAADNAIAQQKEVEEKALRIEAEELARRQAREAVRLEKEKREQDAAEKIAREKAEHEAVQKLVRENSQNSTVYSAHQTNIPSSVPEIEKSSLYRGARGSGGFIKFLLRWGINAIALFLAVYLVPGVNLQSNFVPITWLALIFGLVNAFLRPLLKLLTCPLIFLTLGFFTLLTNTLLFLITGQIGQAFGIGFTVAGFWPALLGGLVVTVVSVIMSLILKDELKKK